MACFKLVLLGELGVGKTSIFLHAKGEPFVEHQQPTFGIESCSRIVNARDEDVTLTIWDTAGVERFRTLTRNYYRNCQGVLLVYNVDNPVSLHQLSKWSEDADEFAPTALKFIVGTKADLRQLVDYEMLENFGSVHRCENAFLLSAKTGEGFNEAFGKIAEKLLLSYKSSAFTKALFDDNTNVNNTQRSKQSSCC